VVTRNAWPNVFPGIVSPLSQSRPAIMPAPWADAAMLRSLAAARQGGGDQAMNDAEMERQLRRLPPEVAELVSKVRAGELPPAMLHDLVAELEDLGRSDAALS